MPDDTKKTKEYLKDTQYAHLVEREYLGVGYHHQFYNEKTKEYLYTQCTEEEYKELETKNIQVEPPTSDYVWVGSSGGTFKVDNPDGRLKEEEFCETPDGVVVRLPDKTDGFNWKFAKAQDLQADVKIDTVWQSL